MSEYYIIQGFVKECYKRGLTEKQATALLQIYLQSDAENIASIQKQLAELN